MDQAQRLRELVGKIKEKRPTRGTRIITVASGKGGVGKTTFACNVAILLSELGKKVLIIDADFGLSNVDVIMGVNIEHSISSVFSEGLSLSDIIASAPGGVKIISGGTGLSELINFGGEKVDKYIERLADLEGRFDYIIVDTGAGINENVLKFALASDELIIVTTPEPTAMLDSYALFKTAFRQKENIRASLVVNMAKSPREGREALTGFVNLAKEFLDAEIRPLGHLPADSAVQTAVRSQVPLAIGGGRSGALAGLRAVAEKIAQKSAEQKPGGLQGFLRRLFLRNDYNSTGVQNY